MAFEYIGDLLEEAVRDVNPLETRGRVEQVVGTIIRAVVPGVKVGELCLLRNPWENWSLKAEVVGFVRNVALLSPLGNMQGISPATEVIPTGEILSVPVGYELLGRVVDGLGQAMDGGPAIRTRTHYPLVAEAPNPMTRKVISKPISLGLRVIDGVLTCGEGQRMGIFAAAGGGKSTLCQLIPRFYDVTGGRVLVDGMDVRDIRKDELRRRIGVVPQKAMLFKGTIRSNLLWGNADATEADLRDALKVAQALDVVSAKSQGLDEPVEQGGRNFSGGQRQRLTIARALVRKPEILILDDSASALDYATDAHLRRAIRQMENPPTTFIVSQRAASVRFADQIIVLDDGRVAGMGTHDELLAACPVYQEIYASQFKKEGN